MPRPSPIPVLFKRGHSIPLERFIRIFKGRTRRRKRPFEKKRQKEWLLKKNVPLDLEKDFTMI